MSWGDLPTWITGIGTFGAVVVALYQVAKERQRRIAQEAENRQERRLAQARLVAAWVGSAFESANVPPAWDGRAMQIQLVNGSAEPVYGLFACIVFIQAAAPHTSENWLELYEDPRQQTPPLTTISLLPPGRWTVAVRQPEMAMAGRFGAEVAFTDRAGRHWIRRPTGSLEELDTPPIAFLNDRDFHGPYDLVTPDLAE